MHLLVIEDERALCETIVRSLRRLAYSVDYCYDGEKALELIAVEKYDLSPVSYTHLDVYKRQHPNQSGPPTFPSFGICLI